MARHQGGFRDPFVDADNPGDAEAMARRPGRDIVIVHPYCGVMEGTGAVRTFMGDVLGDVQAEFDRHATYSTLQVKVSGDLAYDGGAFLTVDA